MYALGQGDVIEKYFVRPVSEIARALAPFGRPRAATGLPADVYRVPEESATPGWLWPVVLVGGGLVVAWFVWPRPRVERRRIR